MKAIVTCLGLVVLFAMNVRAQSALEIENFTGYSFEVDMYQFDPKVCGGSTIITYSIPAGPGITTVTSAVTTVWRFAEFREPSALCPTSPFAIIVGPSTSGCFNCGVPGSTGNSQLEPGCQVVPFPPVFANANWSSCQYLSLN